MFKMQAPPKDRKAKANQALHKSVLEHVPAIIAVPYGVQLQVSWTSLYE